MNKILRVIVAFIGAHFIEDSYINNYIGDKLINYWYNFHAQVPVTEIILASSTWEQLVVKAVT